MRVEDLSRTELLELVERNCLYDVADLRFIRMNTLVRKREEASRQSQEALEARDWETWRRACARCKRYEREWNRVREQRV
jgi:hypothetical protein